MNHSDGHILEVAKSNANQWIQALDLCESRILGDGPDDPFEGRAMRLEVEKDHKVHLRRRALLKLAMVSPLLKKKCLTNDN